MDGSGPRAPRLGEFACRCGEILPPRTSRTGRDFECACGRKGYVEAGQDEQGNLKVVPVFTFEPAGAPAGRPANPPPPPVVASPTPAGGTWLCPCGAAIQPAEAMAAGQPTCPRCGRAITLQRKRQSRSTMISIRPVFSEAPAKAPPRWGEAEEAEAPSPSPREASPAVPPPAPEPTAVFEEIAEPPAPPAPPADEIVDCACGERLYASPADAGRTMECPTCLKVSRIEGVRGGLRLRPLR